MVCLGHEATGVGCTLVEVGMGVVMDGSDVEVDREGVGTGAEGGVGARVISGRDVSLASRIMRSYDVLVPPLLKIMSWDLRKHPEGRCTR